MTQGNTPTFNVGEDLDINLPSSSKIPIEKMFMHMNVIMQMILNEMKENNVQFIDHATSLLHVVASHVWGIFLSNANKTIYVQVCFIESTMVLGNNVWTCEYSWIEK